METWPTSLQTILNSANFSYELGDTLIRSDMDVGPTKVRRRFSKGIEKLNTQIWIVRSLYNTFYNFYNTTLNGGVKSFQYNHPITATPTEFRFSGVPKIDYVGGDTFSISMVWETVP